MVATRSFTSAQVRTVAPGMVLVLPVARQMRTLMLLGKIDGKVITPAGRYGAGWRSMAAQRLFFAAAHGDGLAVAQLKQLGTTLASNSRATVARPGTSTHGDSTRADVLVNEHDVTAADTRYIEAHDWVQEFGDRDPNHFAWHGSMSGVVAPVSQNKIVADWLNRQRLGKSTHTAVDGAWKPVSNFSWLLQTQGHEDGLYPSRYKIDGEAGDRTRWLRTHYFEKLIG